jgi:MFS family permease
MTGLREKMADAGRSLREVFRNPGLRRLQLAWAGSIVGDWAYGTAFAVYAYQQGGPTAVGVVAVVRYVLRALVTPFTAMLGDRYPRRLVMIGSDATAAVLILVGAILIASGADPYAVYALAIVTSLAVSPFRPAQASFLPELANSPEELAASNVASSTIESVGFLAGPAIAGALLAFASISTVYVFDAVTFAWSALLVLGIRRSMVKTVAEPKPPAADVSEEKEQTPGFLASALAGFAVILENRELRILAGLFCAQTVVAGASVVFEVSIALGLLGLDQSGLGYLNATLGIGGLIGGFVALVLVQRGRLARDFGIGVFFWSAPLLLVAAWPSVTTAVLMMVLLGVANSVVDINGFTIIQRITPEETMSRVFGALESAFIGGMAVGALLMPLLISIAGVRWGLFVIGASVAVIVLVSGRALQRIDTVALVPPGLELLRRVSLLAVLPEPILDRLARSLVRVEAAEGEVIIREGDEGDLFYIVESGSVSVTKQGRHVVTLGPSDYVGEIALLRDVPRTATVTALEPTVLQSLAREQFIPALTGQGEFHDVADAAIAARLAML